MQSIQWERALPFRHHQHQPKVVLISSQSKLVTQQNRPKSSKRKSWKSPASNVMAAISSLSSFPALGQTTGRRSPPASPATASGTYSSGGISASQSFGCVRFRKCVRKSNFHVVSVRCASASTDVPPTVAETKSNFLKAYKRPIPSIYNTVLQELLVQQHLMRYKTTYQYDPIFALGFVTVYDQLMEGYPSNEDRDEIFRSYIQALNEDHEKYRCDAQKLEEWARSQNANTLCEFPSREGEVEEMLKSVAERASKGSFSYSRFFAIGLFRLLEMANATEPVILEKLCLALNVSKRSVDRDLDVYRNLLTKLVQAKELLKEYIDREKKKREERVENQKTDGAVSKCVGYFHSMRL